MSLGKEHPFAVEAELSRCTVQMDQRIP